MSRMVLLAAMLALLCQTAQAADAEKMQKIQAYSIDFPNQAILITPLLLRGDLGANVTATESYLSGGMCSQANYWLEQVNLDNPVEHAEITATALYNGDCREKDQEKALEVLQQCFAQSLSCGRKLLEAAENLERGQLAVETAKKLADYGDETGLSTLYFFIVNGRYIAKDPEQAYYVGLLAMRQVSDPELRNVFVATNDMLGNQLSAEKKKEILARADAWKPVPLPETIEEYSKSSGIYVLN